MSNGLFGSTVLDVAIGLIFVYLLLAIICTSLNEWIAALFGLRSKNLALGIRQLLDNQPKPVLGDPAKAGTDKDWLIAEFHQHPLLTGMKKGDKHPSYIPARTFATALMDIISGPDAQLTYESFKAGLAKLPPGDVKTALNSLVRTTGTTLPHVQASIEKWFDDSMDRVSGWYKRKIQWITAVVALLLAFATNADSIESPGSCGTTLSCAQKASSWRKSARKRQRTPPRHRKPTPLRQRLPILIKAIR